MIESRRDTVKSSQTSETDPKSFGSAGEVTSIWWNGLNKIQSKKKYAVFVLMQKSEKNDRDSP